MPDERLVELEALLSHLETLEAAKLSRFEGNAVYEENSTPGRTTKVKSMRDSPEMKALNQELIDGHVRADTVNNALKLIRTVISAIL